MFDDDFRHRETDVVFDKDSMTFIVDDTGDISVFAEEHEPHITHWMPLPEPPKDGDNNG